MNVDDSILHERVAAFRKCAENDIDFAQVIALACATIADREDHAGSRPGDAIRAYFELG